MHKSKRRAKSPSPEQALFCPWLNSLPNKTFAGVEQKLHHEIEAYMKYLQPDSHETATRTQAFQRVKDCVKSLFNQSAINTFGSSATGLSSPTGDIDIVISTPYELKPHVRKKLLFDISQRLRYHNIANEVLVNHWARIPIVTFTTVPELGSFSVDIGINNNDGLSAVKVVKYYLDTMPALKPLVLVVKGLLSRHGLNDASKGGLGSYGIIWMCVSLLQRNPGGQPDSYFTHPSDTESLGYLVVDFMKHYGLEFDFTEDFISVSSGQILKKSQGGDWINKKTLDHICIQDPCQPENDVGRPASKTRAIIAAFEGAYRSLTEAASVTDESLLARLLGVSEKAMAHRALLRQVAIAQDSGSSQIGSRRERRNPNRVPRSDRYGDRRRYGDSSNGRIGPASASTRSGQSGGRESHSAAGLQSNARYSDPRNSSILQLRDGDGYRRSYGRYGVEDYRRSPYDQSMQRQSHDSSQYPRVEHRYSSSSRMDFRHRSRSPQPRKPNGRSS